MITERTLRQWRKDALKKINHPHVKNTPEQLNIEVIYENELNNRILRLTQELLDGYLLRKG